MRGGAMQRKYRVEGVARNNENESKRESEWYYNWRKIGTVRNVALGKMRFRRGGEAMEGGQALSLERETWSTGEKGKHKWWNNGKEAKLNLWRREVIRFYSHSALFSVLIIIYIYMQAALRLADFDRAWGWNRFKGGRQPCLVNSVWLTVERRRWLTGLEAWKISFPSTSDAVVGIERPSSERKKYPVKSVETFLEFLVNLCCGRANNLNIIYFKTLLKIIYDLTARNARLHL